MASCYTTNDFNNLLNAHQIIKARIAEAQKVLELDCNIDTISYDTLWQKVKDIAGIFSDHSNLEEREIIPILKEMYYPEIEIPDYIQAEHSYIRSEMQYLLDARQGDGCGMADGLEPGGLQEDIQIIFEEILVHLFEEENALYPLIQGYLKTQKEKNPWEF